MSVKCKAERERLGVDVFSIDVMPEAMPLTLFVRTRAIRNVFFS